MDNPAPQSDSLPAVRPILVVALRPCSLVHRVVGLFLSAYYRQVLKFLLRMASVLGALNPFFTKSIFWFSAHLHLVQYSQTSVTAVYLLDRARGHK